MIVRPSYLPEVAPRLISARVTVQPTPRAVVLAVSVTLRHMADDPVRALTLAWRALPAPMRRWIRLAGPYGRAAALWGAGDRRAALTALEGRPARLAAFSLAVDQPQVARSAVARLSERSGARPRLAARLAYREGRLTDAIRALDGARGWRAARLRRWLRAETDMLEPDRLHIPELPAAGNRRPGTILHIVTDALPSPAPATPSAPRRSPSPSAPTAVPPGRPARRHQDRLPGHGRRDRRPAPGDRRRHPVPPAAAVGHARPRGHDRGRRPQARGPPGHRTSGRSVLHAASNYSNALIALALRDATRLPVVYEVRGFWEDTWLSRHSAAPPSDLRRQRPLRAQPRPGDALHAGGRPGGDARRGDARRDRRDGASTRRTSSSSRTGSATSSCSRCPTPAALKSQLGIKDGEHVVGLVSSLVAHEGIGTLLAAVKILNDRGITHPRADRRRRPGTRHARAPCRRSSAWTPSSPARADGESP